MFRTFHVSIHSDTEALVERTVQSSIEAGGLYIDLFRLQQEDVGPGVSCNVVQMLNNCHANIARSRIAYEMLVNIDSGTFLDPC